MAKVLDYRLARMQHQKECEREAFRQYVECQREGRNFGYGFFLPPGTGKSATFVNFMRRVFLHEGRMLRTLILCPPVVVPNWKDEILKFSTIDSRKIILLNKEKGSQNVRLVREQGFDHLGRKQPCIFITNYEKLVTNEELFEAIREFESELVGADESHRIKNNSAKRSRAVDEICNPTPPKRGPRAPRPAVIIMSGTPILNNLMDVFSQFLCLDGGDSFGTNFYKFRAKYFRSVIVRVNSQKNFPKWIPTSTTQEQIGAIVARKAKSKELEECIDLPPLIKSTVELEMGAEQARVYSEMKKQLITYVNSQACVAQLAITKALRLMQIASGYVQLENGERHVFKHNPKIAYLEDRLPDIAPNRKVIIWSVFEQNYQMIRELCQRLGLKMVEIHGKVSQAEKRKAEQAFQMDPETRILSGHPGAGGIGINLTAGSCTYYYSSNFSKEYRDQSWHRDYRKGSEIHDSIMHTDLIMKGTIEGDVLNALAGKDQISLSILKRLV